MHGTVSAPPWMILSIIILILTAFLFLAIFPRSDCDDLAKLSANEVQQAMECAAKFPGGIDNATGKACNQATVRLCQESSFSMFGIGFVQSYLGLMVPEYMIYYRQFPTSTYQGLSALASLKGPTIGFTESYPFERAYHGQRPYDLRPTLTQFKQFFKTKYLQEPCTSGQGICFDTRGRQDVIKTDLPGVDDVLLNRRGQGFAQDNPRFYLVAPCYAKVKFSKEGSNIVGSVMKQSTPGGSNYCYMDEPALDSLKLVYAGEGACEVGMVVAMIFSGGSTKAAQVSGEQVAKPLVKAEMKQIMSQQVKKFIENYMKKPLRRVFGGAIAKSELKSNVAKDTATYVFRELPASAVQKEGLGFYGGQSGKFGAERTAAFGAKKTTSQLEAIALKGSERAVANAGTAPMANVMKGEAWQGAKSAIGTSQMKEIQIGAVKESQTLLKGEFLKAIDDTTLKGAAPEIKEQAATKAAAKMMENPSMSFDDALRKGTDQAIKDVGNQIDVVPGTIIPDAAAREAAGNKAVVSGADAVGTQIANEIVEKEFPQFLEGTITSIAKGSEVRGLTNSQWAGIVAKAAGKRLAKMEGVPLSASDQLLYMFGAYGVPCVDIDICRGAAACGETLMWPGTPFTELISDNMKGGKSLTTAAEIFYECCAELNYGAGGDPVSMECQEPDDLVDLIKPDLKLNKTDNITLAMLANYIGIPGDRITSSCAATKGTNSKVCQDALEVRKAELPSDQCWGPPGFEMSRHTYDFDTTRTATNITAMANIVTDGCDSNMIIEIGNDTDSMIQVASQPAVLSPDPTFVYASGPLTFRYLRISETGGCFLDTSAVVLDPAVDQIIQAVTGERYELSNQDWTYFIAPQGYNIKASVLCQGIDGCGSIGRWVAEEEGWMKYSYQSTIGSMGEDFQINGGDRIGIYVEKASSMMFSAGTG